MFSPHAFRPITWRRPEEYHYFRVPTCGHAAHLHCAWHQKYVDQPRFIGYITRMTWLVSGDCATDGPDEFRTPD